MLANHAKLVNQFIVIIHGHLVTRFQMQMHVFPISSDFWAYQVCSTGGKLFEDTNMLSLACWGYQQTRGPKVRGFVLLWTIGFSFFFFFFFFKYFIILRSIQFGRWPVLVASQLHNKIRSYLLHAGL